VATPATPVWAILPFVAYLVSIAVLPLFAGRLWSRNRNKLALALVVAAPAIWYLLRAQPAGGVLLVETAREYLAFMALLAALFAISGGIYLRGAVAGTTAVNTGVLAAGALLASVVGTTGASALLIRPLLRANHDRPQRRHLVVFFIFIVANGGGLLTPLGDPPLFLGFLRGVPFAWTLRLAAPWALVNGALLIVFALVDRRLRAREAARQNAIETITPSNDSKSIKTIDINEAEPLRLEGRLNLVWLCGVVGTVFLVGTWDASAGARALAQIVSLVTLAALSMATTPRRLHEANRFSWEPLVEVGVVFVGVFLTMAPALVFLAERGARLGVTRPWQFFWASGALSSVLDNAPTYVTFASLAGGVVGVRDLGALAAHPTGGALLAAVSCGSVLMGAMTYIGNGPNFMVKAIAEQHHVRMPGFFGYMLWSFAVLLPILALVALVFFR
jgi:Na+/H+ antiporter NhaD/arsenite permease-like protein